MKRIFLKTINLFLCSIFLAQNIFADDANIDGGGGGLGIGTTDNMWVVLTDTGAHKQF